MKEIFKFKSFMKLYIANNVSRFGDSIDMIAYGFMVYQLTGSKLLLATIYVFNMLPNLLFSSFMGTMVGFFSKKKLIIIGDFLRSAIVLLTAYLYYAKLLETWHLFVLTFLTSTIESFVSPSKYVTITKLIDEKHYLTVNSTLQSITKFSELIGLALAGTIIGAIGVSGAMIVNAITFITSGFIITTIVFPVESHQELTSNNYIKSYKEGFQFLFNHKTFLVVIISFALLNFLVTPINALAPAYVDEILNMGAQGLSYFSLSFVIGNIIGGFIVGKIGSKFAISKLTFVGLFVSGIFYSTLSLPAFTTYFPPIYFACLSMLLMGIFLPFCWGAMSTFIMTNVPKEMHARFISINNMIGMSATPLGAFVSGIVVTYIGLKYLLLLFGIIFVLLAFIPYTALAKFENNNLPIVDSHIAG
ncbi:MFS transporter [Clostridiaceae bacterium M8S5]|nr:MFS transporter [Clostridiaceae bacterium M8S5]